MICRGAEMQNGERRLRHKKEKEYGYIGMKGRMYNYQKQVSYNIKIK